MVETAPLLKQPAISGAPLTAERPGTAIVEAGEERQWDGHLLKFCGECDQHGVSTCTYVKGCGPLAWLYNVQRAFPEGVWKRTKYEHIVVFLILATCWGFFFMNPPLPSPCHGPKEPQVPLPRPADFQGGKPQPEGKQVLSGATLNLDLQKLFPEDNLAWTKDLPLDETSKSEALEGDKEVVQDQVQAAKLQAAESVAQLQIGRKMLHKHDHDDDDKHDHEDDHHKGDDHHNKKDKHKHEKDGKTKKKGPKSEDHESSSKGPKKPHPHPGCVDDQSDAALGVLVIITAVVIIVYATEMRTAIRKRFGIKGSKCGDCLAWTFCSACALCQETRTLAKFNVHKGLWHGETQLAEPPAEPLQPPRPLEAPTKPV